jgi:Fic family protein
MTNAQSDLYKQAVDLWLSWRVATASDIDLRLCNFRILFAYNSSKIENDEITYHDTREIFENGRVVNFTGDPRSLFELGNQKLCYEFLKHKIAAREPLTVQLVLEIHSILTSGTYDERRYIERGERPGTFKKHDYVTGREEVGAMPEDVPADMEELLGELSGSANGDPLTAAAYFHARFEHIHPFADGNGRTGRALMNYFLMLNNHPPLIVYYEDKDKYYAALEQYDIDEDIETLCDFLRSQTEKTWKKSLEREARRSEAGLYPVQPESGRGDCQHPLFSSRRPSRSCRPHLPA